MLIIQTNFNKILGLSMRLYNRIKFLLRQILMNYVKNIIILPESP